MLNDCLMLNDSPGIAMEVLLAFVTQGHNLPTGARIVGDNTSIDLALRRKFLRQMAGAGLAATGAGIGTPASGLQSQDRSTDLSGTEFALTIGRTPVNFTGHLRYALTVNGSIPAPILRWKQGSEVTLRVTNTLATQTSIHWHGILVPFAMDGVPGVSFPGIPAHQTFVYKFKVRQAGTYWYHSHTRFQEQLGLYGPLVIEPQRPAPIPSDRDYVVMLSDWTDEDPENVFLHLKQSSDFYNFQLPTVTDFVADVRAAGLSQALARRRMWNQMRMNPTDLADVSAATYCYLVNGATPFTNWTAIAEAGEYVRLRFINGSATTTFDVRIPGLTMRVCAADGQDVEPVNVDEFRIGVAETYDVLVQMPRNEAYTIFAQAMDRSGYARATLAPKHGMRAAIPIMDPKTWLTMADMGMDMNMNGMSMTSGPPNETMETQDNGIHSPLGHSMQAGGETAADAMPGMRLQSGDEGMAGMKPSMSMSHDGKPEHSHPMTMLGMHGGPEVDMRSMNPSKSLADPGPRLRQNGRRVLTYADLRTLGQPYDDRPPGREIVLHLTGNMRRFIWGFDGKRFSEAEPIRLYYGERLRITLVNDTMMNHPMHLHGMFSELENTERQALVRKHTINVQPSKQISFLVTADAPGQWAFHCHLLYHMEAGMFRKVVVA
jgi:CopA family copper-resistance protein